MGAPSGTAVLAVLPHACDPGLHDLVEVARRLTGAASAHVAVAADDGAVQVVALAGPPGDEVRLVEAPSVEDAACRVPLPGGGVLAATGVLAPDVHVPALCVLADAVAAHLRREADRRESAAVLERPALLAAVGRALAARGPAEPAGTGLLVLDAEPAEGGSGLTAQQAEREVARRLRAQLRPADVLARLADSRWAVLLADLPAGGRYVALGVADRLVRALAAPVDRAAGPGLALASTGLAFAEDDTADAAGLLARAEAAAGVAVRRGPARFHVFRDAQAPDDDAAVERLLREALADGTLVVHYQPVVGLPSRRVVGVEALVRLRGPDGRLVPPDRFIPVAERCGLIGALGDQVRRTAMRTVAEWKRALPPGQDLGLGVNLSVHELDQPGLVESLRAALAESGLDADALNLELTESAFLAEGRGHEQVLGDLRELGPKLFIDDFGTGFSSLSYLRRFPVDGLKIDRSFVGDLLAGPQPRAVTGAIVHLAQELGVHVVAEGVETDEQADLLAGHGCRLAQGYLFSRPAPAEEVRALLVPRPRAAGA